MHIICLTPLEPGVYNDHKADHITAPPPGWAYIPEDFPLPATFPRLGSIEAEELPYAPDGERQTMLTVTAMTAGTLPEAAEAERDAQADTDALLIDHELRLTLLELGLGGEVN